MDVILSSVIWQSELLYLDDIVVFSKNANNNHKAQLRQVLTGLRDAGVTIKLKRRSFFEEKINYLGHVIQPGRQELLEATSTAALELRNPTTQTRLTSFSNLCSVFRRFVTNFSRGATPFNKKLRKDQPTPILSLTQAEKGAVENLRTLLTSPRVLDLPGVTGQYTVDTAACYSQVGCVPLQKQEDGLTRPIG